MFVIIIGIQFLSQVLDSINTLRSSQRMGSGRYVPSQSNRRHVVICGKITRPVIEELLTQLFNDSIRKVWDIDIGGLEVVIMVPKDCYDVDTFRWLKSKWLYDQRVTYLSGDIVEETGALRASVKTATACFLFPEMNCGDDDTVIRAVRIHQLFGSNVALFVMLHSARLKPQLLHARIPEHRVLCLDELKFKLVAAAAAVPGSTNLLLNLLSFSTLAESRTRLFGGGDLVLQAVTRKREEEEQQLQQQEEEEEKQEEHARLERENLSGGEAGSGKKTGSLRNLRNFGKIHSNWKSLRQKMKRANTSFSSRHRQGGWSVDSNVRSKQRMVVDKGLEVSCPKIFVSTIP